MFVRRLLQIDYQQSLFPLRDSRGKRTSVRARKSPASLKQDARVEPLTTLAARHARHVSTPQAISRSLACSFSSTIPERKERLLVVNVTNYSLTGFPGLPG